MGSSPLPVSLQSKFLNSKPASRLRDYRGNLDMYVLQAAAEMLESKMLQQITDTLLPDSGI